MRDLSLLARNAPWTFPLRYLLDNRLRRGCLPWSDIRRHRYLRIKIISADLYLKIKVTSMINFTAILSHAKRWILKILKKCEKLLTIYFFKFAIFYFFLYCHSWILPNCLKASLYKNISKNALEWFNSDAMTNVPVGWNCTNSRSWLGRLALETMAVPSPVQVCADVHEK